MDIAKLKLANLHRWNAATVKPELVKTFDQVAHRLIAAKPRYQTVEASTHVPWAVIGVIHERESSQSWKGSLAQGDPWDKESIHIPRHRGPFASWEAAAVDALTICPPHAATWEDWSIGGALTLLETYNGTGYASMGMPSPYIWAGTDRYRSGKYIADGHFDPDAIDHQLGCAGLLARMTLLDPSIQQEWHP